MFVYELSGSGFEYSCSLLNFKFRACFEQEVPWHSGNYRVWIHSQTRTWHDKNIQSYTRCVWEASRRPCYKNSKLSISLDQESLFLLRLRYNAKALQLPLLRLRVTHKGLQLSVFSSFSSLVFLDRLTKFIFKFLPNCCLERVWPGSELSIWYAMCFQSMSFRNKQ